MSSGSKWIGLLLLLAVVANVMAYRNAKMFFNYTEDAERIPSTENMAIWQRLAVMVKGIHLPKPQSHSSPTMRGMPFQDIQVTGRGDVRLSAWYIPAEDPEVLVVMFHGYNSEKSGLIPEATLFHRMGHDIILVDFPGAGDSPGTTTSLGILEAEDVARVSAWARENHPNKTIVLYGHSMGGAAVMRALALYDARPDAAIVESVFDSLLQAIRNRFALMNVPSWGAAEMLLFWGSVQLRANGFAHRPRTYAEKITTPVMMIHGGKDDRADWRRAEKMSQRLRGKKHWLLMENAQHTNPSLSDPERWIDEVSGFIIEINSKTRID